MAQTKKRGRPAESSTEIANIILTLKSDEPSPQKTLKTRNYFNSFRLALSYDSVKHLVRDDEEDEDNSSSGVTLVSFPGERLSSTAFEDRKKRPAAPPLVMSRDCSDDDLSPTKKALRRDLFDERNDAALAEDDTKEVRGQPEEPSTEQTNAAT